MRRITEESTNEKEFLTEIATQLTELNFHEETFEMDIARDELGFTPESLEFYKERYKEVKDLYNTLIKNNNKMKTKEEIVIKTYYIINEDGSITYDFEQMAEEFENELAKLDDSVVIMCSVEY